MTVSINTQIAGGGSGGGASDWGDLGGTLSDQTDLQTALDAKVDYLTEVTIGSGSTNITHASHLNRVCVVNQAGATTGVFAATATSGALSRDGFELYNTGAGTWTASGAITAPSGYTLTCAPGSIFTAIYDSVDDAFISTTVDLAAGDTFYGLVSGYGTVRAGQTGVSTVGALGTAAASTIDSSVTSTNAVETDGTPEYGSMPRVRYTAAANAANRNAGFFNQCQARLTATGLGNGRFPVYMAAAISDANPTLGSLFIGLIGSAVNSVTTGVEPSAITVDNFGFGCDSGDTNYQLMWNDNAGSSTKVDLGGTNFARASTQFKMFIVKFDKNAGGTELYLSVYNVDAGVWSAVSTASSNLPRNIAAGYNAIFSRGSMADTTALKSIEICGAIYGRPS